jgi:hypothetical protein
MMAPAVAAWRAEVPHRRLEVGVTARPACGSALASARDDRNNCSHIFSKRYTLLTINA